MQSEGERVGPAHAPFKRFICLEIVVGLFAG